MTRSFKGYLLLLCFIPLESINSDSIFKTPPPTNARTAHSIGRSLAQCFGVDRKLQCLQMEAIKAIETAIADNSTWRYGDFMEFEKQPPDHQRQADRFARMQTHVEARSVADRIGEKLLELAHSRTIRLRLPDVNDVSGNSKRSRGISDALDDLTAHLTGNSGGGGGLLGLNVAVDEAEEGRKKKDKDKNMAMMGGMAMMAMVAQMFLGKVILIAGAAFVMAKIALLVSVLGSLKKGSSGSSGSTEHIIVSGGGGGGGGHGGGSSSHDSSSSSGWHRSMPYDDDPKWELTPDNNQPFFSSPIVADASDGSAANAVEIQTPAPSYYGMNEPLGGFL